MKNKSRIGGTEVVRRPLLAIEESGISDSYLGQLRKGWLTPPEAIYFADAGNGEAAVVLLGQAFMIPAEYFDLALEDFSDHLEHDPALPWHARARRNDDERGGRAADAMEDGRLLVPRRRFAPRGPTRDF